MRADFLLVDVLMLVATVAFLVLVLGGTGAAVSIFVLGAYGHGLWTGRAR